MKIHRRKMLELWDTHTKNRAKLMRGGMAYIYGVDIDIR